MVIFMKIVCITKKKLLKYCFIALIVIIVFTLFYLLKFNNSIAIELTCDSEVSDEFLENIKELTKGKKKLHI